MSTGRRTLAVGLIAITSCSGSAIDTTQSRQDSGPVHLAMANLGAEMPTPVHDYIDAIGPASQASITIDARNEAHRGEADQEVKILGDVAAGRVDMAWVGARAFDQVGVTAFQPLLAPFLVDNYALQDRVFEAGIPERMLSAVKLPGVTTLGVLPGPLRKMTGVDHQFVELGDYSGARVGTSGGGLAEATFRALGADPIEVPAQASLDGLDAIDFQLSAVQASQFYDSAQYLATNLNLWPRPVVLLINTARFDALTDEQRRVLRDTVGAVLEKAGEEVATEERDAGSSLCETKLKLVTITDAQRGALVNAIASVYFIVIADPTQRRYFDEIIALKSTTAVPPDNIRCT